jgi:hypothetical protein
MSPTTSRARRAARASASASKRASIRDGRGDE